MLSSERHGSGGGPRAEQAFCNGENFGEGCESNKLKTEEHGNKRVQERMHVKAYAVAHDNAHPASPKRTIRIPG